MHFRILHTRLQSMWIESVLGHSFLACNLLWPCSLIETSDTELSLELAVTEAER